MGFPSPPSHEFSVGTVADLMILRRDEITIIDDDPPQELSPEQGVS